MLPLKAIFIQSATLTGSDAYFKSGFWKSRMVEMYKNSPSTKLLSLRKGCRNVFIASKISPPPLSLSPPIFSLVFSLVSYLSLFRFLFTFLPPYLFLCPAHPLLLLTTTKLNTTPRKSPRKLLEYSEASWMHCHVQFQLLCPHSMSSRKKKTIEWRKREIRCINGRREEKYSIYRLQFPDKEACFWKSSYKFYAISSIKLSKNALLILMTPSRVMWHSTI